MSAATAGRDTEQGTAERVQGARGGRGWIAFAVVNGLIVFFGLSYAFFPMGTVRADGNHTTGVLEVPREIWGGYVIASGVAMLAVALYGFASRRRSARGSAS